MAEYKELPDTELAALLQQGDREAYTEIYNRYYAALYIHAYKRLRDREECRDIIQELFIAIWSKRGELVLTGQLSGYLYTAVRNRIFDRLAKGKLKAEYVQSVQDFSLKDHIATDHLARQNILQQVIDQEIQALPARTREVFELSRKGHFTHREIAEQLGISEQTVKTTVSNALKVLRVKLGPLFFLL